MINLLAINPKNKKWCFLRVTNITGLKTYQQVHKDLEIYEVDETLHHPKLDNLKIYNQRRYIYDIYD